MKKILSGLGILVLLTSCAPSDSTTTGSTGRSSPKVYVSIVTHEEEKTHYEEDEDRFNKSRKELVAFAQMLHEEEVAYNYESDWTFLLAAVKFDKGDSATNGKNFLRYFKEDLGFEIDPHAHETKYNYADVAYLIKELGVEPSHIVGGFLAYPAKDSQLDYLQTEIKGDIYDYSWKPEILWGGAVKDHENESDLWVSGIWRPKSAADYLTDDRNGGLPNIGGYLNTWEGLDHLLSRNLDSDKIYTITIFVPQRSINDEYTAEFKKEIEKYKLNDRIVWAGLSEVMDAWKTTYNSETNMLKYDGEDARTDASKNKCGDGICDTIEKKICSQDC